MKLKQSYQIYLETLYETFNEQEALTKSGMDSESLTLALDRDSELKAARDTFFTNYDTLVSQRVKMLGASYLVRVLQKGVTKTLNQRVLKTKGDGSEEVTETYTITHEPPPSDLVKYALQMQLEKSSVEDESSTEDNIVTATIDLLLNS